MPEPAKNGIMCTDKVLSPANIKSINELLRHDFRVELIPTKNGVLVFKVRREEIKS